MAAAADDAEEDLAIKQLAEFNQFLSKARSLFNSDPSRVSVQTGGITVRVDAKQDQIQK